MRAGFIGLGAMGRHMARNLHKNGLLSAAWNRSADKSQAFAAETGAPVARDIEDLAARSDGVVICVSADADVLEIVERLSGVLPSGALVVDRKSVV